MLIYCYFGGISLATFAEFGWDKLCAMRNRHRIPEAILITLSFAGGRVGAKLGQRLFRHKTTKQPFGRRIDVVPLTWTGVLLICVAARSMPTDWMGQKTTAKKRDARKFFSSARN